MWNGNPAGLESDRIFCRMLLRIALCAPYGSKTAARQGLPAGEKPPPARPGGVAGRGLEAGPRPAGWLEASI